MTLDCRIEFLLMPNYLSTYKLINFFEGRKHDDDFIFQFEEEGKQNLKKVKNRVEH